MDALVNRAVEEDLIGLLLQAPEQIWDVQDILTPASFGDPTCGAFYASIQTIMKGNPATLPLSLVAHNFRGQCETAPVVYLAQLKARAPAGAAAVDYVDPIEDMAIRRAARKMMEDSIKALGDPDKPARVTVQTVQSGASGLLTASGDRGKSVGEIAMGVWDDVLRMQNNEKPAGIRSGLSFWDGLVGNMMPEDLIILGGSTAMGKSALAAQVAINLAMKGYPALYLSHEMSVQQITLRFQSQLSKVSAVDIEEGNLNAQEERRVMEATATLRDLPLWIESPSRPTVMSDLARANYYAKRRGLKFAVVDHLGYVKPEGRVRDRFEALDEMVKDFKAAAKESKLPWLVLSHLNRDNQKRPNKRPIIGDLFGASEIEKSADTVTFIHREQYWLERSEPPMAADCVDDRQRKERADWEAAMQRWRGRAEVLLAKRRRGRGTGSRECEFIERLTMFTDISAKPDEPPPEQINLL